MVRDMSKAASTRTASLILAILILILMVTFYSGHPQARQSPDSSRDRDYLAREIKIRLGSTPPSCYNKCNACHPCKAVQVPTFAGPSNVDSGSTKPATLYGQGYNGYSNYKPLDWKCLCSDHLYNP